MVNVPGRSKGCSTCRQRKLKCDETSPECSQCVKKGLRCPGPRTGAVFIHALPYRTPVVRSTNHVPVNIASQKVTLPPKCRKSGDSSSCLSLLSDYQPSRVEIFDQLFVTHFIDSFAFAKPNSNSGKPSSTWLDELAKLIVSPTKNAVKHSIRASSMFFYGFMTQNVEMQTEASRWYLKALRGLQNHISKNHIPKQNRSVFSGDMICTAVMLTHFESLAGTAPGAWFQHVRGASMMIATGGPESCRQGFLHDIFRHLRLLTAISALFRNEQHPFSTGEWMSVPFELLPKGPFDELVDVFFSLLPCLALAGKMINSSGHDFHACQDPLSTMIRQIITRLHIWWSQCVARTDLSQANPEANLTDKEPFHSLDNPYDAPILPFRDMPTTALAALFYAANIIVFRLLFLVSPSAHKYEFRIQKHVQATFSALDFVSTTPQPVSQRGFIMVALPLRISQIWGPCIEGDHVARPLLDKWAQNMPNSAAPTEFFAHVASYIHNHYHK